MPRGRRPTHGMSTSLTYGSWIAMKKRCSYKKTNSYELYGGRGISVDPKWIASFPAFLADVGERPSSKHSLDRIDPNGHYVPGNVRWATRSEQARNRRHQKQNVVRTCERCAATFQCAPYVVRRGEGRYCSRACASLASRSRSVVTCPGCGQQFERTTSQIANATQNFCSVICKANSPEHIAYISALNSRRTQLS